MKLNVKFSLSEPVDFWELNPTVGLVPPFSELYNNGKNREYTSRVMWYLSFLFNPDSEENRFAKMSEKEAKEVLKETFIPDLKENAVFKKCYMAFPNELLTSAEIAVNAGLKTLRQFNELFLNTELTLDETLIEVDPNSGKKYGIQVKGTAKQIEGILKNFEKTTEKLEKALVNLRKEKEKAKGIGGAYIPKSETMWD